MVKLLSISGSSRFTVTKLVGELASLGIEVKHINLDNEPLNPRVIQSYDAVLLTAMNPYTALSLATISSSINSMDGIINLLSVPRLLKEQGVDYSIVSGDNAVKSAFVKGPYYFNTLWSLDLGGFVDTVEGARSILEYRHYLKNQLAESSLLANVKGGEERVFATINHDKYGPLLRRLGLQFARLTVVDGVAVEGDPSPEVPVDNVKDVALLVFNHVKR